LYQRSVQYSTVQFGAIFSFDFYLNISVFGKRKKILQVEKFQKPVKLRAVGIGDGAKGASRYGSGTTETLVAPASATLSTLVYNFFSYFLEATVSC
jgi:hypothetical protein